MFVFFIDKGNQQYTCHAASTHKIIST